VPPPTAPREEGPPPHPATRAHRVTPTERIRARPAPDDRPSRRPDRAARLHPKPSRPGARHQPVDTPLPPALPRDDRAPLGNEADPRRRTRPPSRRTPPAGTRAATAPHPRTPASTSSRRRRSHPQRARRRQDTRADRRRTQRRPHADSARRCDMVAINGASRSTPLNLARVRLRGACSPRGGCGAGARRRARISSAAERARARNDYQAAF
jgi:hypothetical protein